jgi:hypothetical protein
MRASLKASVIAVASFLWMPSLHCQVSMESWCARQVTKNMEATRKESPKVFATVVHYVFEWSKSRQACVMVVQYRARKNGAPMIQIVATNAVTMQPMEAYKNIFLVPEGNETEIEDATNFLFEKYSH